MKRTETVRLYPTRRQVAAMEHILHVTRHLYNAALEERREAYRLRGISLTNKVQSHELTEVRAESRHLSGVYRECEDAALRRLDHAYSAFFRRIKSGEAPGFPRFRSANRWRQIGFAHGEVALRFDAGRRKVRIPGAGMVKFRAGRAIKSFGRAWITEKNGHWYAHFECDRAEQALPRTGQIVGLDRGVTVLLAASDGSVIENPRPMEQARLGVERAQRVVSRRCKGGRNRKKAVAILAGRHERVARQRRDHAHKVSRMLVNAHDVLVLEDLNVKNMVAGGGPHKNGLNRVMHDASFGLIARLIEEKAESAARQVVYVDPRYTSQTCAQCGHVAKENRSGIRFVCLSCGHADHADVNAARVILSRAQWGPLASRAAVADGKDPRTALSLRRTRSLGRAEGCRPQDQDTESGERT